MVAAGSGSGNSTEEKSMVPTVIVGIGGTGAEILSRVRRIVEQTYGGLEYFPIISFLWIDTDEDYKLSNPNAAGTPLTDKEKHWARVSGRDVENIVSNMEDYPWINSWFPNELERKINSLEKGAGQIRACGRFAFFCNHQDVRSKFIAARDRIKGYENFSKEITVKTNEVNVFVVGSICGGTGSGMLIDLGYSIRKWLEGESTVGITAIVPMPDAFAGIDASDGVLANGYAALMELSYFSDDKTEYVAQFSRDTHDEIRNQKPPFDFTYLVGTKNEQIQFTKLDQIREAIAQNIFLDLTSDFAYYKRSIRDNIAKRALTQADGKGRGYPRNFMSFGLSTIEIPISQIRACLANRLAKDLVSWWLNESVQLPPQMLELVRGDILKEMKLTELELISALSTAKDLPIARLIAQWRNGIHSEITAENLLQCTQQGTNFLGKEKGKILTFTTYLQDKLDTFQAENLKETSPDERVHGEYLQIMYRNRDEIIKRGRQALEAELYRILEDRNCGVQFADVFLTTVGQLFEATADKFRREQEVQAKIETSRIKQYEDAKKDINELRDQYGTTKKAKMEQLCEVALAGIESSANAAIRRKARTLGLQVIVRMKEHLQILQRRLNRFQQRTSQLRDYFNTKAQNETDSADVLEINGIKLYDRTELNSLYQDLIEQLAGAYQGSKTLYEQGIDSICTTISKDVLKKSSPLWKETRNADEEMNLFDLTEVPDVNQDDLEKIIYERTKTVIEQAPQDSRLKKELAACDRIFKAFNDDTAILKEVRIAYKKSQPLMLLDQGTLLGTNFDPLTIDSVALLGGKTPPPNSAADKLLPKIREFVQGSESIKPLGETERHRIVFVNEIGGFSLRCIQGMDVLRQSYQKWLGDSIEFKRKKDKGEADNSTCPNPVHLTKEPPFWDIFPEDPKIYNLVVKARALRVLFEEKNRATKEQSIRYVKEINLDIDDERIDIASNWEEVSKVLEVKICRPDKEEIERQVNNKLDSLEIESQKQEIYRQLTDYINSRAFDLEKMGGKDSPIYKREKSIIVDLINEYNLGIFANQTQRQNSSAPSNGASTPKPEPAYAEVNNGNGFDNDGRNRSSNTQQNTSNQNIENQVKRLKELYIEGYFSKEEFEERLKRLSNKN